MLPHIKSYKANVVHVTTLSKKSCCSQHDIVCLFGVDAIPRGSTRITTYWAVSLAALVSRYCSFVFCGIGNRIGLSVGKSQRDDELRVICSAFAHTNKSFDCLCVISVQSCLFRDFYMRGK